MANNNKGCMAKIAVAVVALALIAGAGYMVFAQAGRGPDVGIVPENSTTITKKLVVGVVPPDPADDDATDCPLRTYAKDGAYRAENTGSYYEGLPLDLMNEVCARNGWEMHVVEAERRYPTFKVRDVKETVDGGACDCVWDCSISSESGFATVTSAHTTPDGARRDCTWIVAGRVYWSSFGGCVFGPSFRVDDRASALAVIETLQQMTADGTARTICARYPDFYYDDRWAVEMPRDASDVLGAIDDLKNADMGTKFDDWLGSVTETIDKGKQGLEIEA